MSLDILQENSLLINIGVKDVTSSVYCILISN